LLKGLVKTRDQNFFIGEFARKYLYNIGPFSYAGGVIAGPVGWICLGAAAEATGDTDAADRKYTFDCWKPVVRDESVAPSDGMLIKDVLVHPNIKAVQIAEGPTIAAAALWYPQLMLENIWDEKFQIEYVTLDDGVLAAHAYRVI